MLKSCAVKKSSTESEWLPTNKENNEIQDRNQGMLQNSIDLNLNLDGPTKLLYGKNKE